MGKTLGKTFQGSTEQAGGGFLGADFWKKGMKIEGVITGQFETSTGLAYSVHLTKEVQLNGEKVDRVSIGGLKGFQMAVRAAGVPDGELLTGDAIIVECTGFQKTNKGNDQINFKVLVNRP
jgi:hypothetical protein